MDPKEGHLRSLLDSAMDKVGPLNTKVQSVLHAVRVRSTRARTVSTTIDALRYAMQVTVDAYNSLGTTAARARRTASASARCQRDRFLHGNTRGTNPVGKSNHKFLLHIAPS